MTKSLKQQWEDDCKRLTEPSKQYERQCCYGADRWFICMGNEIVESALNNNIPIRRIESIGLQFDLKDAQNGGKVEVFNSEKNEYEDLEYNGNSGRYDIGIFTAMTREGKLTLRMKESRLKTTGASND